MKRELFETGNKRYSDFHYDKGESNSSVWYLSCSGEHKCTWISCFFFLGIFPLRFQSVFSLQILLLFSASCFQRGSSDSHSSEELPTQGGYRGLRPSSSGSEDCVQELFEVGIHPCNPSSPGQKSSAHDKGTGINKMTA